jgi:hypothetical protein
MTSRRSPPRRSSGNSRAAIALFAAVAVGMGWPAGRARADHAADALKQTLAGAAVDWEVGTISATGGAAADLRMPTVDLSRPGAQRRAHTAAVAKLRAALTTLPLGSGNKLTAAEIERAVGRARDVDVQYQSNGGAIVRVEIRFGDWLEAPSAPDGFAVAVASMHLSAAPTARVGKRDVRVGAAVYRVAEGKGAKNAGGNVGGAAVADGRVDKDGRLVLSGDAQLPDRLARGQVIIYVGKLQR